MTTRLVHHLPTPGDQRALDNVGELESGVGRVIEKYGWVATLAVLFWQARITAVDAQAALPDGRLGLLPGKRHCASQLSFGFARSRPRIQTP